jgi:hypothetical protein
MEMRREMKVFQNLNGWSTRFLDVLKPALSSRFAFQDKRNHILDLMKGLLIIAMVFSHIQRELNLDMPWLVSNRWMLELLIFSGLIFAFGYSTCKAYMEKEETPRRRMFLNIIKILAAYYLCAIAYKFFNQHSLSLKAIFSTLRLDALVPYTEFLLSYLIIMILILIVPRFFYGIARKDAIFWPSLAVLLVVGLFDFTQVKSVWLSLLVGSGSITSFPVVQYLPLYLLGIYFAQRQIRFSWKFLVGAILALSVFLFAHMHGLDTRFPPNIFWIVGSMGAVYLCYLVSHLIFFLGFLAKPLMDVGRHTLYWLVASNIFMLSTEEVAKYITFPTYWIAGIIFAGFFYIAFLSFLARQ